MNVRLILASKSPARLKTLHGAGVNPVVMVSAVNESAVVAEAEERHGPLTPADQALLLARAKAEAVCTSLTAGAKPGARTVIVGCDSIFELDGVAFGKPRTPEVAFERIRAMSGRSGLLHTGHWVIDMQGPDDDDAKALGAVGTTTVNFGVIDDDEITAYIETGEPLEVAGSFTVDGLGGPFVESIEGDYHNVVGLSLPLLRDLLAKLEIPWRNIRNT